jgi:hypothetical protein
MEVRISSKRLEMARERLESGDEVQRSYTGRLDKRSGTLMGSNSKLVFVEEKGFLSKTFNVVLDLPYEKVREFTPVNRYKLRITDLEGGEHEFVSDVHASTVDRALKQLIEAERTESEENEERSDIR